MDVLGPIDRVQRRHAALGFPIAVVKKFSDDSGGNLIALLSYYAFLATFPLLLAMVGVLGIVLNGNTDLQTRLEESALREFPIIGDQIRSQVGIAALTHSTPALIIGLIGAFLGGRGLSNAVATMLNTAWSVPKVERPNALASLLRALGLMGMMLLAVLGSAALTWAESIARSHGVPGAPAEVAFFAIAVIVDAAVFLGVFRVSVASIVPTRSLATGAVLSAVAWAGLFRIADLVVSRDLRHATAIAGLFGTVLGMLAWFALQATVTVYAVELDVVRARRLYPRGLTGEMTSADRMAIDLAAAAQVQRRGVRTMVVVDDDGG
jgi:membrane protein